MYDCDFCDKSFANKSNLNRHNAKKHPFEDNDSSDSESIDEHSKRSHIEDTDMSDDESYSSDEEEDISIDIWNYLHNEEVIKEVPITTLYKQLVLISKALKQDEIHQAVMHTVTKAREEEDMDFREALDYAIDKRKFLIQRRIPKKDEEDSEEED